MAMQDSGFIGLGTMGRPMAANLLTAGYREVSRKSQIVITMLPDTQDVEQVLFGSAGVAQGLTAGKTVVDKSSISPFATRDFAARISKLGCAYLDA